ALSWGWKESVRVILARFRTPQRCLLIGSLPFYEKALLFYISGDMLTRVIYASLETTRELLQEPLSPKLAQ
ncbi:hypothetical protein, partial [Spirosoma utsteinense]|uniref:hypothetical protein n=1 Tax=Spirosoma utsteinense TaxID=2585773 RepID=UPI001ABC23A0